MLPPQYLPESELQKLIGGALKDSIQSISNLTCFASDLDACTPAQYLRIISWMYDQLDVNKIPNSTDGEAINLPDSKGLDVALASLVGIGVTLPIWLNHPDVGRRLINGLSVQWPEIRRWIIFLFRNIITKPEVDLDFRVSTKTAVLEFLGLVRDRLLISWSKSIPADRELMRMICHLWLIETHDARFASWSTQCNTQRESAVLNSCFLIAHETDTAIDWDHFLSLFQHDPELIATVTLCHLDHEISRTDAIDLNCIAWDLHIATLFGLQDDIRLALMRQGMMKAASEILTFVVDRTWEGDARVLAARCMTNAVVVLRSRIEDMDALPFLHQALQRGLVPSLLKCEALLPFAEQPLASRQPVFVLGEILVGYTVYRSILNPIARAVDEVVAERLDARLTKGGELFKAWNRLRDTVEERRRLVRRDIANGHIQTCQNDECSKTTHMSRFKRCGGCLHAYYCSQTCQRYDWQNGKHKQYCMQVHTRFVRTYGQMSTVHSKDLKFLDRVILAELRKHRARLSAHPSKLTLVDLNLVGSQTQAVFDARGMNTNPFGIRCVCELFAGARWKQMVDIIREGKRSMVLVRAFISGGWSRKIVLQAIPLSVVTEVEQSRRRKGPVERYQFNLIFTCCGSEGDEPRAPFKGMVMK